MPSIQAIMLMLYLQTQRRLFPPSEKVDLDKERAGLDAFSDKFKPLAKLKHSPLDVDGVVGEWITPGDCKRWAGDPLFTRWILPVRFNPFTPHPGGEHRLLQPRRKP